MKSRILFDIFEVTWQLRVRCGGETCQDPNTTEHRHLCQMFLNYSYWNISKLTNLSLSRGLSIQLLQIVHRAWPAHKTIQQS